ncbi:MAG: DUF4358 domain-containing protein [Eubacteriales bacterium]
MKNLKQLGILGSTALLSLALLTACGGEGDTEGTNPSPSDDTTVGQDLTPGDPVGDMSLGNEDDAVPDDQEIPSDDEIENSDPNATPPPEDIADDEETETEPETEEQTPEDEAAPDTEPETEPETPSASDSAVDLNAFYQSVIGAHEMGMLEKVPDDFLPNFYAGLENVSLVQNEIYMAMMTAVASELALVEVANAADAETVKGIFQARIDAQVDGGAFYPEATEVWTSQSAVVSNGNYVMMVVHPEYETIVSNFNSNFS